MGSDSTADRALANRRATIQSALADRPTANSSPSIYATAQQSLEQTNHLLGVTLLTTAEACTSDATEYDQWTPAALAVEYLAAFARTHGNIITVETSDVRHSDTDDDCQLSKRILTGDLLHTRAVELLLEIETPHTQRQSCLQRFLAASRQICEGNALRQELAGQPIVQLDDYLRFIEADATLWWGSATIGGLLGDGEDELLTHLASFGRNLGAAIRLAVDANCLVLSSPLTTTDGIWISRRVSGKDHTVATPRIHAVTLMIPLARMTPVTLGVAKHCSLGYPCSGLQLTFRFVASMQTTSSIVSTDG